MATIIIIHGLGGHNKENWFPWLQEELNKLGHTALVPNFPNSNNPQLNEWEDTFNELNISESEKVILVGHSLGVPFILTLLETRHVNAAFLVGGFVGKLNHPFDEKITTFIDKGFSWKKITQHCKHFTIYNSNNDPYVSLEKGEELAVKLNTQLTFMEGAGHFNSSTKYNKEFPELLQDIKNILSKKQGDQ